jgi:hypothetical protein
MKTEKAIPRSENRPEISFFNVFSGAELFKQRGVPHPFSRSLSFNDGSMVKSRLPLEMGWNQTSPSELIERKNSKTPIRSSIEAFAKINYPKLRRVTLIFVRIE